MNVEINIEKLLDYSITIEQYLFCQFIYQQQQDLFDIYLSLYGKFFTRESLDELLELEYLQLIDDSLGYRFSNIQVTVRFIELFIDKPKPIKVDSDKIENWINDWYELFPKGVKSGDYPIRSGLAGCLKKMKKFIKEYPEYSKDVIIKVTKKYVNDMKLKNYAYIKLAHYLIYKDDVSVLASLCEEYNNKSDSSEDKFIKSLN